MRTGGYAHLYFFLSDRVFIQGEGGALNLSFN